MRRVENLQVRDWYIPRQAQIWRGPLAYAHWLNPDVTAAMCPEDPALAVLLADVEVEALACVQNRVPAGIPDLHSRIDEVLGKIDQFKQNVRALAQGCDAQGGFQVPFTLMADIAVRMDTSLTRSD